MSAVERSAGGLCCVAIQRFVAAARATSMSDEMDDPQEESSVALRAKAAHCMKLAELMSQETRARLIQKANDYLEHAAKLEEAARKE